MAHKAHSQYEGRQFCGVPGASSRAGRSALFDFVDLLVLDGLTQSECVHSLFISFGEIVGDNNYVLFFRNVVFFLPALLGVLPKQGIRGEIRADAL